MVKIAQVLLRCACLAICVQSSVVSHDDDWHHPMLGPLTENGETAAKHVFDGSKETRRPGFLQHDQAIDAAAQLQVPMSPTTETEARFRPAQVDDADEVVTVFMDAFSPSKVWQYIHLNDSQYANYTHACGVQAFTQLFEEADENVSAFVIAVPAGDAEDTAELQRKEKVVSFAIWLKQLPDRETNVWAKWLQMHKLANAAPTKMFGEDIDCSLQLDVNQTRLADLMSHRTDKDRYFTNVTFPQLTLELLATHPEWDGHGFGARQVQHGLRKAAKDAMPVTLMATPAGYPLYQSLGFESVANFTYSLLDGFGDIWNEYMRWTPPAEDM